MLRSLALVGPSAQLLRGHGDDRNGRVLLSGSGARRGGVQLQADGYSAVDRNPRVVKDLVLGRQNDGAGEGVLGGLVYILVGSGRGLQLPARRVSSPDIEVLDDVAVVGGRKGSGCGEVIGAV